MKYIFGKKLNIKAIIDEKFSQSKKLLLCDNNLYSLYPDLISKIASDVFVLEAGEASKSKEKLFEILNFLMQKGYTRNDCIVSFGGGVIGDIGGLAASLYMRGMEHIIIATSIIAMADSSIGGKTAINFKDIKNIFGTFYEPSLVIADTDFLCTLPNDELKSGLGELLKVCLMSGDIDLLFGDIESAIEHVAEYKINLVKSDLYDTGMRHLLNFGHTMGHAIEPELHISHGEAVAMGIDFITSFGDYIGVSDKLNTNIKELMHRMGLRTMDDIELNSRLLNKLYNDKKREKSAIKLVMLENIGKPIIKSIDIDEIISFAKERFLKA